MSAYAINYAFWTAVAGSFLEYAKRRGGGRWQTLLWKGGEKGLVNLVATWAQNWDLPFLGSGLDANYLYNAAIAGVMAEIYKTPALQTASDQVLASLIGHRLAVNFATTTSGVSTWIGTNVPFLSSMFANSGGYSGADIRAPGVQTPSDNSGNNMRM
jgi:hypothetical protein